MERYIRKSPIVSRCIFRVVLSSSSSSASLGSNRHKLVQRPDKKLFHNSSKNHENARNLARDTRMAGRRRFFKTVDVSPVSPPWETIKDSTELQLLDNPISAGVDGSNSATNISLEKPTRSTMKQYLSSPALPSSTEQWYGVTLDGRLLKTPLGTTLSVPSLPLALAIASEWDDQGTSIKPAQMPLMTLVCTTLDQLTIPAVRERTVEDLLRYLRNDTTCYWADATEDRVLHRKQQKHWEDLHNWIDCELMGLGAKTSEGHGSR
jgi:Chaperone required for the assembly of the mitochondrial F1-ATPase